MNLLNGDNAYGAPGAWIPRQEEDQGRRQRPLGGGTRPGAPAYAVAELYEEGWDKNALLRSLLS